MPAKKAPPDKAAKINHLDGCPESRIEERTRKFYRKDVHMFVDVVRCTDCGQAVRTPAKPVEQ